MEHFIYFVNLKKLKILQKLDSFYEQTCLDKDTNFAGTYGNLKYFFCKLVEKFLRIQIFKKC